MERVLTSVIMKGGNNPYKTYYTDGKLASIQHFKNDKEREKKY